mmetsp:Transcript_16277/g.24985  ORF Transcript_16277/g.24985 Transcript_16277/m.24985 type:complete len:263 (+) Transcript_16277:1900-2688(+)
MNLQILQRDSRRVIRVHAMMGCFANHTILDNDVGSCIQVRTKVDRSLTSDEILGRQLKDTEETLLQIKLVAHTDFESVQIDHHVTRLYGHASEEAQLIRTVPCGRAHIMLVLSAIRVRQPVQCIVTVGREIIGSTLCVTRRIKIDDNIFSQDIDARLSDAIRAIQKIGIRQIDHIVAAIIDCLRLRRCFCCFRSTQFLLQNTDLRGVRCFVHHIRRVQSRIGRIITHTKLMLKSDGRLHIVVIARTLKMVVVYLKICRRGDM